MKLTKIMICGMVALALSWAGGHAAPTPVLIGKVNISGKATVNDIGTVVKGNSTRLLPVKIKYNTKDILALLNESSVFTNYLAYQTGGDYTQTPANAYLAMDFYTEDVYIMLKNGTMLAPLYGSDGSVTRAFMVVQLGGYGSATYTENNNTGGGSETDEFSNCTLTFRDYNPAGESRATMQGMATLKFNAGKASSGSQQLRQNVSFNGAGYVYSDGYYGTGVMKFNGSGKDTVATSYWPFWVWWD